MRNLFFSLLLERPVVPLAAGVAGGWWLVAGWLVAGTAMRPKAQTWPGDAKGLRSDGAKTWFAGSSRRQTNQSLGDNLPAWPLGMDGAIYGLYQSGVRK
jgi:hypothetical protein